MPEVTVKLSYATLAAIDAMRGDAMSRERWLSRAARQVVEDGMRKGPPKQPDDDEEDE